MPKGIFFRLARNNLSRNRRLYLPYAAATAIMSAMFFIILNTILSKSVSSMSWGATTMAVMVFGLVVMAIFTIFYMLYLNSFLIKQRKKEFGLYGILGLEKRHVGRIILIENLMLNSASLLSGLIIGTVFGRLCFMALLSVMRVAGGSKFVLSWPAYLLTALFFMLIFFAGTLYNQLRVRLVNPISLINGEKMGEKRIKGIVPLTIAGVLCLGAGYFCSLNPAFASLALVIFWPAVILVIAGTNLLFLAGSQFILGGIKKNKKLYYKPRCFVSVSGLMHRMKQNASGLSNICILSTMVLVTLSMVFSMYFGQEAALQRQYRNDLSVAVFGDDPDLSGVIKDTYRLADEKGVTVESLISYDRLAANCFVEDGRLIKRNGSGSFVEVSIIALDQYNAVTKGNTVLADNEVLILTDLPDLIYGQTEIAGFRVKALLSDTPFTASNSGSDQDHFQQIAYIVAPTRQSCAVITKQLDPGDGSEPVWATVFTLNFEADGIDARADFSTSVLDLFSRFPSISQKSIDTSRADYYAGYGGLLFVGVLFSLLFMVNTAVIMYFKQVSEGYEDRGRYAIMRKVGMSDDEVRKTINSQVLIVFFAPLAVAVIHMFAATTIVTNMLLSFSMANIGTTAICIAVITAIYAIVYAALFKITARSYYKIVK